MFQLSKLHIYDISWYKYFQLTTNRKSLYYKTKWTTLSIPVPRSQVYLWISTTEHPVYIQLYRPKYMLQLENIFWPFFLSPKSSKIHCPSIEWENYDIDSNSKRVIRACWKGRKKIKYSVCARAWDRVQRWWKKAEIGRKNGEG